MLSDINRVMHIILNSIPMLVWVKKADGNYVFANNMWLNSFGFSEYEVIGRNDLELWGAANGQKFIDRDNMVMESRKALKFREWTPGNRDKPPIFFETTKIPLFDDDGNCIGTVGIASDMTLEKNLDTVIEEAVADLKAMYGGGHR